MEEHLSGLPKPFISKMENLNVDHFTSNGQRVELLLQRREFLIDEVKKFKLQIALRPNPSQVCPLVGITMMIVIIIILKLLFWDELLIFILCLLMQND